MIRRRPHRRWYGVLYIYLVLWLIFSVIHFTSGWVAFVNEQETHLQPARWVDYLVQWGRDVSENNQSEFLQLLAQSAFNSWLAGTIFLAAEAQLTKIYVLVRWVVRNMGGDPTQIIRDHDPDLVDDQETAA